MKASNYRLFLFDFDGTLAEPASGSTFRKAGEPYVWLPKRREMLTELHEQGAHIGVCTNQGGIAAGHLSYGETEQAIYNLLSELHFYVPFLMCPYVGTYAGSEQWRPYGHMRKPSGSMLLMLMAQYPALKPSEVVYVGDRSEDDYAARNSAVDFQPIHAFMMPWLGKPSTAEDEEIPF